MDELVRFRPPRVKVCGLTRAEDVLAALAAGADALGFVHHARSPRSVALDEAAALAELVPSSVLRVGVLVDARPDAALEAARRADWSALQLCGSEIASDWVELPLPLLRRVAVDERGERELEHWSGIASLFVLDHPAAPGGSGLPVELALAARLAALAPCLLAGGLDATNVAERIEAVHPAGVDASSRLERAPGRKDARALRDFVRCALEALEGARS